jgi:hypothetical protein
VQFPFEDNCSLSEYLENVITSGIMQIIIVQTNLFAHNKL